MTVKALCHRALGLQFCLRVGKKLTAWKWRHGDGGKPRAGESLLNGGRMEWIEGGETSDKGLGMIRNGIPVRTLRLNSGVDIMLGEGSGVVGMKRGIAAEESVGDDVCAEREQ